MEDILLTITAKIRLSLRRKALQTTKIAQYDWFMLDNSDEYTITQRNKFDPLQEISETLTPNDKYENFVKAHMEAAAVECIPTKLRSKHRVSWETLAVKKKTWRCEKKYPYALKGT